MSAEAISNTMVLLERMRSRPDVAKALARPLLTREAVAAALRAPAAPGRPRTNVVLTPAALALLERLENPPPLAAAPAAAKSPAPPAVCTRVVVPSAAAEERRECAQRARAVHRHGKQLRVKLRYLDRVLAAIDREVEVLERLAAEDAAVCERRAAPAL